MSSRLSFILALLLLLAGAVLLTRDLTTLPPALYDDEITNIRIAEAAQSGNIEVFYDLGDEGREGLYHIALGFTTWLIGDGMLSYRMLSVWSDLVALTLVYAVALRLLGRTGALAAMAVLLVGFWPNLLARHIIPQTLLPVLVAGVLLALSLALPIYRRRRKRGDNTSAASALGVLLGFGLYVHPIGLLVLVFSLAFIVYMIRRRTMSRRRNTYISLALLLTIIIGMPYLISALRIPEMSGLGRLADLELSPLNPLRALGGLFVLGDNNPLYNLPERPLFDPITFAVIAVGIVAAASDWRKPRHTLLLLALIVLSPIALLAADAPHFPAYSALLPLFGLFFGLGVITILDTLPRYGRWLAGAGLLALLAANAYWMIGDLYTRWPERPEVQAAFYTRHGQLAHHIDRTADEISTVVCGWRVAQMPTDTNLSDAQYIELMLNHKHADVRYVDCYNALVFTQGGDREQVVLPDPGVVEEAHPAVARWLQQGRYQTGDDLPNASVLTLDVEQELADYLGQITAHSTVWFAPETGGSPEERVNTPVAFGDNLTLLGYAADPVERYTPGQTVVLVTYWRVDGEVPRDLQLFTHILGDPGASPPANADILNLNPTGLRNRDIFIQVTYVPLAATLPAGEYVISIGAYRDTSDERLVVLHDGAVRGTRLFLYTISVN